MIKKWNLVNLMYNNSDPDVDYGFYYTDENGDEHTKLDMLLDRNTSNDPLELFIDKEKVSERMKICEQNLSKFEKEVLKHYLDGEKQSEIARNLNKDVKSIDNTIQRIKSKLKWGKQKCI